MNGKIYLSGLEVYPNGTGSFGFGFVGTILVELNPDGQDPNSWKYNLFRFPNTNNDLNFASAMYKDDKYVYFFGSDSKTSSTPLARISQNDLENFELNQIEYWSTSQSNSEVSSWNSYSNMDALTSIFPLSISEFSVQFHSYLNKYYFLYIPPFTYDIYVVLSDQLTGPWDESYIVYNIPSPWNNPPNVFCYAVKSHPEFERQENEIVLSFMSNVPVSWLSNATFAYIPQFIRIQINE